MKWSESNTGAADKSAECICVRGGGRGGGHCKVVKSTE